MSENGEAFDLSDSVPSHFTSFCLTLDDAVCAENSDDQSTSRSTSVRVAIFQSWTDSMAVDVLCRH